MSRCVCKEVGLGASHLGLGAVAGLIGLKDGMVMGVGGLQGLLQGEWLPGVHILRPAGEGQRQQKAYSEHE